MQVLGLNQTDPLYIPLTFRGRERQMDGELREGKERERQRGEEEIIDSEGLGGR